MGATGFCGVSSSLDIITLPPQQSTTASKPFTRQATKKACRPPEQPPMTPIFPLQLGSDLSNLIAASQSPTTQSSGTAPCSRTLAATSSGVPCPNREYKFGQITKKPCCVNRRAISDIVHPIPACDESAQYPGKVPTQAVVRNKNLLYCRYNHKIHCFRQHAFIFIVLKLFHIVILLLKILQFNKHWLADFRQSIRTFENT